MSKRQHKKWELKPRDHYCTIDPAAFPPKFIEEVKGETFAEPCYGRGHIEEHLKRVATCNWRSDIEHYGTSAVQKSALNLTADDLSECALIVTNPPFTWGILEGLLKHLPTLRPTWLLLPADMAHNVRMAPYMARCSKVISVGRLYWQEDKPVRGVDNFAWYKFHDTEQTTIFIGRER